MKRRGRALPLLRLTGRLTALGVGLLIFSLIAVQFARVIGDNVSMTRTLYRLRGDVARLQHRRAEQLHEIARLRNPAGTIPEIHDRLRLVRPNETLVFVKPDPTPTP